MTPKAGRADSQTRTPRVKDPHAWRGFTGRAVAIALVLIPINILFMLRGLIWGESRPATVSLIFNVVLSDIPEKKTDYVTGRYTLLAPKGKTTAAVKIVDMLGEEVVLTHEI